jgi:hypothetical protein
MQQQDRQALAAEVLEMGEQLFSLAQETQTGPPITSSEEDTPEQQQPQPYPFAELAAASSEFFTALRLLLDIQLH